MANFSHRSLLLMLAFAVISCRSISPDSSAHRHPAAGKATLDPQESARQVEINVETIYSPRRFSELESAILLDPGVQECLRTALAAEGWQNLSIGLEGRISYTGDTEAVWAEAGSEPLKNCLETHISALKHGRGIQGPFKMRILGPRKPASRSKGIILDLQPVKKFE